MTACLRQGPDGQECPCCVERSEVLVDYRDALYQALRDRDAMAETLTAAQVRGTQLHDEVVLLRARLARYGEKP